MTLYIIRLSPVLPVSNVRKECEKIFLFSLSLLPVRFLEKYRKKTLPPRRTRTHTHLRKRKRL